MSEDIRSNKAKRRAEKLNSILDIAKAMMVERVLDSLLNLILVEAKRVVGADRCTIFILDQNREILWSRIAQGLDTKEIRLPIGQGIAGWVAANNTTLNIPDAYSDDRFNRNIDHATGYQTRNILCVPMRGARGELVGCVQALNRTGTNPFDEEDEELLLALGGQAAGAIQNTLLHESIERLFDGMVRASVVAIESRDPTTSGHSSRVADLTEGLALAVDKTEVEPYRDVTFSKKELRELRYASLLHDFGKVGVRESVLVKANKLYPEQFESIRMRFELARISLERNHYKNLLDLASADGDFNRSQVERDLQSQLAELDEIWALISKCNMPALLDQETCLYLEKLLRKRVDIGERTIPLLTAEEFKLLSISRGSLSNEERHEIERHVTHSYRFLSQIPWTQELKRVPEIAYAHHEKLDSHGYPRGLSEKEIPLGSRIMAIADIYDALTASDRPYKKAVPHDKAIAILKSEAERGFLDKVILQIFIDEQVPQRYLSPPTE